MSDRVRDLDPDALAALEEQRAFLLRSLDDLEREHAAGDVDDHDYAVLKDDYTARAAATIRAVDERRARFREARGSSNPWRTGVIVAAIVGVAVLAGVLVAQASGRRGAGDTATGDISRSVASQLDECIAREATSDPLETLRCYDGVLDQQPSNVAALTYRGWFLVRAGSSDPSASVLLDNGVDYLDRAIEIDPGFADARVFRAVAYRELGDVDAALAELDAFDALGAPPDAQLLADQLRAGLESRADGD